MWKLGDVHAEPVEVHVPPRQQETAKDYVRLRRNEGFVRVAGAFGEGELASYKGVTAYLMLYEDGLEGHSDKVVKVIESGLVPVVPK